MQFKILELRDLIVTLKSLRESGKRIVFTNGCFDILHVGHVRYLAEARAKGDVLVVGLNSDASVKSIKFDNRPVVIQDQRAEVLAGLACVDYITIFDEPDPLSLIQAIKPDVLVKGADWEETNIIGSDVVKAYGGKVVRIKLVPDISTSSIIRRILKLYGSKTADERE
ncbi:MAG: D-glycero-beta-D-manno-heptose 1-phosphate adenylyltransferase [Desulfobacterales bacterium]